MKAVLFLADENPEFYPITQSPSFLPVTLDKYLISYQYSWINSYFSKDKIYVVCTPETIDLVKKSCHQICDENIIVEPFKINYSVSLFFVSLVLNRIDPDTITVFFPGHFLFSKDDKIQNWLYAISELCEKDWLILPGFKSIKSGKNNILFEGGKHLERLKSIDFFTIDQIKYNSEAIKSRKLFGKIGKILYIVCGKIKSVMSSFLNDNHELKCLFDYFSAAHINWQDLNDQYQKFDQVLKNYCYFKTNKNFLTFFLNKLPDQIDSWTHFYQRFALQNESNLLHGNLEVNNCRQLIAYNFDEDQVFLENLSDVVFYKKNGLVAVKKYRENL